MIGTHTTAWEDETYAISHCEALFGKGFNVYKKVPADGMAYKINNQMSWFTTLEAAQKWLESYKRSNTDA